MCCIFKGKTAATKCVPQCQACGCRAREKQSGKIHALKKIKMERETEGFPLTSIREINILLALHHKNIVNVTEVWDAPPCVLHATSALHVYMTRHAAKMRPSCLYINRIDHYMLQWY